ncbi:MAG: hypothetical protein GY716_10020 [bacterium]|nr:hypothetical protein [bacterium]
MNRKWNEDDEVPTVELEISQGGTAGSKGVQSQGGGQEDEQSPQDFDQRADSGDDPKDPQQPIT